MDAREDRPDCRVQFACCLHRPVVQSDINSLPSPGSANLGLTSRHPLPARVTPNLARTLAISTLERSPFSPASFWPWPHPSTRTHTTQHSTALHNTSTSTTTTKHPHKHHHHHHYLTSLLHRRLRIPSKTSSHKPHQHPALSTMANVHSDNQWMLSLIQGAYTPKDRARLLPRITCHSTSTSNTSPPPPPRRGTRTPPAV